MSTGAVTVTRGIVYGTAEVGFERPGGPASRPLKLDLYEPAERGELRPAVVLAFGGAFHRGSREDDSYEDERGRNTPISAYCHWLATLGYVAASIDYRLVPEDPVPGDTPTIANIDEIPSSRASYVRTVLGLSPATQAMLARGIESATDDMAAAFRFIVAKSAEYGINPDRIAVGGFSAGGRIAFHAAFGEGIAAAAIVSLSGFMMASDLARLVDGSRNEPPVLMIEGEHDLDFIRSASSEMKRHFAAVGLPLQSFSVPGASHFYRAESRTDGEGERSVRERIAAFLTDALRPRARNRLSAERLRRIGETLRIAPADTPGIAATGGSTEAGLPVEEEIAAIIRNLPYATRLALLTLLRSLHQ